jgi:multiple sugar transport system permease protein
MAQPTVASAERVIPRRPERFSLARALENPQILGMIFAAPAIVLLGVFLAYPFVLGFWLSFTDTLIGGRGAFIGIRNYLFLLGDSVFRLTTFNTILYTVVAVWFKLVLGLALALVLNWDFRWKGFLRAIILLPWIVPTAFSAIGFWWLFDSTFSPITWLLMKGGLLTHRIDYLGDPSLARASIIIANVWRGIPFFAIGFLADFQLVWIITRGGPANATHLYGTLAFQRAIPGGAFGEGAAISNFILPVLVVSVLICYLYLRRES